MEPWPLLSTKRSRSAQCGLPGLCLRWRPHSATAMSAMPIGAPGWPELACCTASIARARMAFAIKEVLEAMAVMGSRLNGETPHFTGPDNPPMHGLHLTADLRGCSLELPPLTDPAALRDLCLHAVRDAALQPVGVLFHTFPAAGGVTGVVLLAVSHLAVHTWP